MEGDVLWGTFPEEKKRKKKNNLQRNCSRLDQYVIVPELGRRHGLHLNLALLGFDERSRF